ncbi:site-2 protease family protein [Methanobacterium sp. ACI-7]|uniref:site-2 protease family protein n=1 Tax=unclassified Methanobacterium TaxID=2627676 RepID=UPI0039C02506
MNALWYYAIAFVIIWVLAFLFKDKLKIDITGPLLMRRTLRMRNLIDSIAQKSPRFWKGFMNIGIPVSVLFMGFMIYALIASLQTFLQTPAASPILPGVDYPGNPIFLPLEYGLIGLATVIVVHEFAHGILARAEGIKIKSIGVLLLAILPGAFVEPDPEGVKKASRLAKLRIYAAGSIFNLAFAGICLVIFFALSSFVIPSTFSSDGILVSSVVPNSPSDGILKEGMVIYSVNGKEVRNYTDYVAIRNTSKIGDVLTLQTNQGTYQIKLAANPNNATAAYAGFRPNEHLVVNKDVSNVYGDQLPWILIILGELLRWIGFLNLAVGTFNLLPMKPLDGGLIFEEILSYKLSKEKVKPIVNGISYVLIAFLLVNIIYGLGRGILLSI